MPDNPDNIIATDLQNTVQTSLAAGTGLGKPTWLTPDGIAAPLSILPAGYDAHVPSMDSVEEWLARPLRKKGRFGFADADSFIRYFNEHKTDESRIFAKITDAGATFEGIVDFHGEKSSFNEHVCNFSLRSTHEFDVWRGNNKQTFGQEDFAGFLEENSAMFSQPGGLELLELVETLEATCTVNVASAVKLQNRTIKFTYNEEVDLKGGGTSTRAGGLEVPATITAHFPPFDGVTAYDFPARLRYKIADRKLTFWYDATNMHLVVRAVALDVLSVISKQTGVEPFKV